MNNTIAGLDVSRETFDQLQAYGDLLRKWNPRINLVAPSTLADLWQRHITDSAQVFALSSLTSGTWVDLGSGGGLPGIVCAILAKGQGNATKFVLVESDKRKAAFLAVCQHSFGLNLQVETSRAEGLSPVGGAVVSARALAPLPELLPLVARHLAGDGVALLPKGKNYEAELEAARADWQFDHVAHASLTDSASRILAVKDIRRV
jgi:16S rRNA (guanine527-N7)-methyltransferase